MSFCLTAVTQVIRHLFVISSTCCPWPLFQMGNKKIFTLWSTFLSCHLVWQLFTRLAFNQRLRQCSPLSRILIKWQFAHNTLRHYFSWQWPIATYKELNTQSTPCSPSLLVVSSQQFLWCCGKGTVWCQIQVELRQVQIPCSRTATKVASLDQGGPLFTLRSGSTEVIKL